MPVRLTLCDLRAPGWVEPWFPLRVVLFLSHVCVWQCYFLVLFVCFGFSRHTNPSDDAKVIIRPTVPARSPCHFAVLCVVVFFSLFLFFWLCFCLVFVWFCFIFGIEATSQDYVSGPILARRFGPIFALRWLT